MNRHFILTHGRSGSNFLANCLNKHQSLVNYGEVLGEWTQPYRLFKLYKKAGKGWPEYLDALYTSSTLFYAAQSVSALKHLKTGRKINFKRKSAIKSLGVKDFVFLTNKRGLMDYLRDSDDLKVIYLTRRNHFSRYLSLLNMKKTGIVKSESHPQEKNQYTIDVEDLLNSIEQFKLEEDIGDKLVENIPASRLAVIDYQDYFSGQNSIEKTNSMVFEFLEVQDMKVSSTQRKILSSKPSDHILNYEEVSEALIQAGHENYLV